MPLNPRGQGPNAISTVLGDKVVVVGDHPNLNPSLRTEPTGVEITNYGITGSSGMTDSPSALPSYTAVDNSGDFHGGNYTVTALNGIHFESAGGGTTIDSSGNVAISSWGAKVDITSTTQTGVKGHILHLMATNTVRLSGPTFYVDAQETIFKNKVSFGTNVAINGGMYVNGELYARHITAPHAAYSTADSPTLYGYPQMGATFTAFIFPELTMGGIPSPLDGGIMPGAVRLILFPSPVEMGGATQMPIISIPPHNHKYDGIACSQAEGMTDFFKEAQAAESNEPAEAKPNLMEDISLSKFAYKVRKVIQKRITKYMKSMLGFG